MTSQKKNFIYLSLLSTVCAGIAYGAAFIAAQDDTAQTRSLQLLTPLVNYVVAVASPLQDRAHELLKYVQRALEVIAGVLVITGLFPRQRAKAGSTLIVLSALTAIYAQIDLVLNHFQSGLLCYGLAAILLLAVRRNNSPELPSAGEERPVLSLSESCVFLTFFVLATILRFYAINYLPDYFEGEESPFSMAGNDLVAMTRANLGDNGPWSPFGYLYFINRYVTTQAFGATVAVLRFAGGLAGLLILVASYLFLRNTFSRTAALAGAFLLSIDPKQLGWARYEFPHGSTAFTAVMICWLTVLSFKSRNLLFPLLLAIFMGLCFHQYPSGQTAFMIPWLYLGYLVLLNRQQSLLFYASRVPFLILGVLLWYYGQSFVQYIASGQWDIPRYFERFDGRVSWKNVEPGESSLGALWRVVGMCWKNFEDLFASMITKNRIPMPPQEFTPSFGILPVRTAFILVPPLVLFSILQFLRHPKWKEMAALLCWMVAAAVPSVLSNEGHPRRAATIFLAVICIAAVGYGVLRRNLYRLWRGPAFLVVPLCEILFCLTISVGSIHQWFSGQQLKFGEDGETALMREVKKIISPNTLVLVDYSDHYMPGRLTYLMLDFLRDPSNRPVSWRILTRYQEDFDAIAADPRVTSKNLGVTIQYRWTHLRTQVPEIEANQDWKNLVYISERFQNDEHRAMFDERMEKVSAHCVDPQWRTFEPTNNWHHIVKVLHCRLKSR